MDEPLRPVRKARVHVDGVVVLVEVRQRPHPLDDVLREERALQQRLALLRAKRLVHGAPGEATHRREAAIALGENELRPAALDDPQPGVLVVSAQRHDLGGSLRVQGPDEANHLGRLRTAVDIVAEEHDGVSSVEPGQPLEDARQRFQVPVDVTDSERPRHSVEHSGERASPVNRRLPAARVSRGSHVASTCCVFHGQVASACRSFTVASACWTWVPMRSCETKTCRMTPSRPTTKVARPGKSPSVALTS